MTSDYLTATGVHRRADGHYDADLDIGWAIGGNPHGGYLMALLSRAAVDATEAPHPLAVSAHFLRPPHGGPAEVRTEVVKRGRTVSTARVTLWQDERPHLDMLVTTGRAPDSEPQHAGRPMPAMAGPDECRARTQTGATIELADHIDVRIDPATSLTGGEGEPVIRGWMSLRDGTPPDMASLLIAVDVAPPTVAHLGFRGWAPTVELTALLRSHPQPGWLAFEARTTHLQGGWFDEESAVWDETGRLVAQSRQLALVAPPKREGSAPA